MTSRRRTSISPWSLSFILSGFCGLLLIWAAVMPSETSVMSSNLENGKLPPEVPPAIATTSQQFSGLKSVAFNRADFVGQKSSPVSLLLNAHAAPFSGSPYTGTAISLPGRIEAENFDNGGEGVAYHDTTSTNDGGAYRSEGVDVCTCGSPYGYSVGWTQSGEWMEYTVAVSSYGVYKFQALTATTVTGTALHVEVDGVNVTGQMILPNTGAWGSYATTSSQPVALSAGQHIVRVGIDVAGFLIDSVDLVRLNTPYGGTAASLPGTVQAENFDNGGEGVAYHDTTTTNDGGAYRSEGVDLCACAYASTALGWSQAGEWTRYTVNATTTDTYTLQAAIATIATGSIIHLELDGVNVSGQMVLPNTGAWGNWTTISKSNVQISAGQHDLKMVIESGGFLLDSLSAIPSIPSAPSALSATAVSTSQINLSWTDNSFNESGFKIERKTGSSGTYSEIATTAAGVTTYNNSGLQPSTQYFYRVRATNLGGDSAYSSEASAMTSNLLPSVSVTSPGAGVVGTAPANVTIQASASDSDGSVSKVEFFQGATKLGEDLTSPYSFSWTNVAAGTYSLTAKATDNAGGITTSAAVAITVNAPPTISLTLPAANATFTAGATIAMSATSTDTDGTISKVEFYQGATKLGEVTATPYTFNWTNVPVGNYSLSAVATDDRGASTTSTAVPISVVVSSAARLDPMNQTGGSGENPLSRNFNWTLPIVSLPGRAGMDLGVALSYNSLVWTRSGNIISFDDDNGFPAPGFRLGFPVIQPLYHNSEVGTDAYLLIGSDGSRTELRRVGSSALFEAGDSSHLLLDSNTMILRGTDGTQMTYSSMGAQFNCTQIEDRNGNYITINYNASGKIDNIHDTLDRLITFNYSNGSLSSITQVWKKTSNPAQTITHTWANFSYTDLPLQPNFSGLTTIAPTTVKTPSSVTFADGSHSDFSYTSWGQVWKISNFAADSHLLNYRSYKLPGSPLWANPPAQTDCPKFTERRDWAQMWHQDGSGVEQEVITTYSEPVADSWTMPNGWPLSASVSGKRADITTPDGTMQKIYFIDTVGGVYSPWQRGLPALVVTYDSGGVWRRKAMTVWTQDNTSVSYELNPRVSETNIYDPEGNRARVQMTYQQFSFANNTSCYLPRDVYEYDADATTKLRSTRTDYNTNAAYTDRRIIGLVSERQMYQGDVNSGGTLMSKVGFFYDNDNGATSIQGTDAPVRHDNTNYSASFVTGRANLSSVRRYDVTNTSVFTTTRIAFNTAGAPVSATDALSHITQISYSDAFSNSVSWTTLAYPTKVTDPDGYYSTSQYNFDSGSVTYRQTPPPNATTQPLPSPTPVGPAQTFTYDDLGRLERTTSLVNNAYTRYQYPASQIRVESFSTLVANKGEAYSFKILDGFGREIANASDHPATTGTSARFDAQRTSYDIMGRVVKTSNPAETSAIGDDPTQWQLVEGDLGSSWFYTQYTYDWKGRLKITTNTDGTTKSVVYEGCGCAGGEVATLTDEGTLVNGVVKTRQRKIYSDVLGRTVKTEVWNFDGTGSGGVGRALYSTSVTNYNLRDQVSAVRQFKGAAPANYLTDLSCPTGTCQKSELTYDGYGRLQTQHVPEQNQNPYVVSSWTYNDDDTVNTVTDGRGAMTTYGYGTSGNNRRLLKSISYTLSGSLPINMSFDYDAAGNRKSMTHSINGIQQDSCDYTYDQLSRLTSETRHINALVNSVTGGDYTIGYQYTLGGQVSTVTDSFSSTTNLNYDAIGRTESVTGSYAGVNYTYADDVEYRAWGAVATHGAKTISYNNRMQPTQFRYFQYRYDYNYHPDGNLKHLVDLDDVVGQPSQVTFHYMSRDYGYDAADRLTRVDATDNPIVGGVVPAPFVGYYGFDEFNNLNSRSGHYALNPDATDSGTFVNNRRTNTGWSYDADGRVLTSADTSTSTNQTWAYDAAGNQMSVSEVSAGITTTNTLSYDGNNEPLFESVTTPQSTKSDYLIRSTVLGGVLTKLDASGNKDITYVPANGLAFPMQTKDFNGNPSVTGLFRDVTGLQEDGKAVDPFGAVIQNVQPPQSPPPPNMPFYGATYGGVTWNSFTNANNLSTGCFSAENHNRESCNNIIRRTMGDEFVDYFSHLSQLGSGENNYISGRNGPILDDPSNGSGFRWHPGDDGIPGHFGNFESVIGHVRYGSLLPQDSQESIEEFFHRVLVNKAFLSRLGHCLRDLFHSNPYEQGFVNKADGSGGSLRFKDLKTNNVFNVTTDATTYTAKQLASLYSISPGLNKEIYGVASYYNPYINFIASNRAAVKGNPNQRDYETYLSIQVHETGNSIALLLGDPLNRKPMENRPLAQDKRLLARDRDSGMALEECVFGAADTLLRHGQYKLD